MEKKIVIKVSINSEKEKKAILKAVAKLEGINQVSMDAAKGTLTVIGEADPVCIIASLRKKCGRCVEIDTVGPPKPPEKKEEKPKPKSPPPCVIRPCPPGPYPYPYCCEYETNPCSIL